MYTGKTLFTQLMDFLPWTTFARIVERYSGDRYVKSLRCAEHFRVMAFAQLTYRESLRDIEACLSARRAKTDRIDGEALLRALMAHKRGEPRVCARCGCRRRGRTQHHAGQDQRGKPRAGEDADEF